MNQETLKLFHKSCKAILQHREAKALDYAIALAKTGLHLSTAEEVQVQALYILSNISHWRTKDTTAKVVRDTLKFVAAHT